MAAAGGSELLSMVASLVVVIGAILVFGWLYSRARGANGGASDVINVVATRALGAKERLMVVEIGGQQLLVGMTASNVQTLHVFDKPVASTAAGGSVTPGFASRLKAALKEMRQ